MRVLQPEGTGLSPHRMLSTGGSALAHERQYHGLIPGGDTDHCDVSLGHTEVPLSPGAVGHPWSGMALFRGGGSPGRRVGERE